MAKKVSRIVSLQIPAGQASPAPPVGTALGPTGVDIMAFTKAFNAETADKQGMIIPVVMTIYEDRSFTFITKEPPASILIKDKLGLDLGSGEPNTKKVGTLTQQQLREVAEAKMPDLNAASIEGAMNLIAGTARSMGIEVEPAEDEE